jgi:outer membrane protein assembly factor BamD
MLRRIPVMVLLGVLAFTIACNNKRVSNPIANVDSKQPDKVLFDRSMAAMKHNQFDVARMTLQTLINTYPDSEFLARAKLSLADSWYAEGGSSNMAQAEAEYNDFITFFPNMPEAAEAQLKIANIHFNEMEKPDRDYTHAERAEEEYRKVIMQYPENTKVVAAAKMKLMEVQEVLAEREFRVGKFYYMQTSYPAAIARLKSLTEAYPLYSKADEALFTLGQSYEAEIARVNLMHPTTAKGEAEKAVMLDGLTKNASDAYSKILTRYPVMDRALDAKGRLVALHQTVPHPTKAAVALNRAEEASRREATMLETVKGSFSHHPDMSASARVGDPTLVDPKPISATDVIRQAAGVAPPSTGNNTLGISIVSHGDVPPNQDAPHSDNTQPGDPGAAPAPDANSGSAASPSDANNAPAAGGADSGELKPNVAAPADPNELKPNVADDSTPAAPPQQMNEIQAGSANSAKSGASSADQETADDSVFSSSKKNKKKGLKKVNPF